MKKTFALLLATLLVFAGCKATDPKDAFFSALERNSEVKNAHEVAAISLVMDNEGSPYTFMAVSYTHLRNSSGRRQEAALTSSGCSTPSTGFPAWS